jgi:RnfABCDGE-type electron transport complex B subunit
MAVDRASADALRGSLSGSGGHDEAARIDAIDRLLPQTQCTQCGFNGCRPYAQAIALEQAPINRCPPGGAAGIAVLAQHTGRAVMALDPNCGVDVGPKRPWEDLKAPEKVLAKFTRNAHQN